MSNYIDNIVKNAVTYDLVSKPLADDIANEFSIQSTYAVGDYVMHDYKLYKCISAITTAGNWNSAKWQECKIGDEINGGVKYTAQTLTSEQKAQARNNIGAVSQEEATPDAVRYSAQSLTDAQKNQARVNVGTVASTSIAEEFSTSKAYAVGDLVMYDSKLYKFKTAHSAGAWNVAQVDAVSVKEEISSLSNDLSEVTTYTEIGNSSTPTSLGSIVTPGKYIGFDISLFTDTPANPPNKTFVLDVYSPSDNYIVQDINYVSGQLVASRWIFYNPTSGTYNPQEWAIKSGDMSEVFKSSLLECMNHLAWESANAKSSCYDTLYYALYGEYPTPEWGDDYTWLYNPADGEVFSSCTDIITPTIQYVTESIANGILNLKGSCVYDTQALIRYAPKVLTNNNAKLEAKFRINSISPNPVITIFSATGFRLQLSNGTSGVTFYAGAINDGTLTLGTYEGTTEKFLGQLNYNQWYVISSELKNGEAIISLNGEQVHKSSNLSTYYTSENRIQIQTIGYGVQGKLNEFDVDVAWITYKDND